MPISLDEIYKAVNRWRPAAEEAVKDTKYKVNWTWEALQGDFNPHRSMGQVGVDAVVSLVPGVDQVMDVRDIIANVIAIARAPAEGMAWFSLLLSVVGLVPELGSVAKGVVKLVFVKMRPLIKSADDLTNASKMVRYLDEAFDAAWPEIMAYLRHPKVQQFLTRAGVPDVLVWVAKSVRKVVGLIDVSKLKSVLDKQFEAIKCIVIYMQRLLPEAAAGRAKQILDGIVTVQRGFAKAVDSYVEPLRAVMRRLAVRLEEAHWVAYSQQVNKGWIAPLSEQGAKRLIKKHRPGWVKTKKPVLFDQLKPDIFRKESVYKDGIAKGAPELADQEIRSFANGVKARPLLEGETLYRVVDPTSGSLSTCWITEAVWKEINKDAAKAREMWRSQLAVKPHWNQNGTYVKFTYNKARDGEITVWEGPTAMQFVGDSSTDIADGFLEGGLTQVVWHPLERPPKKNQLKDAKPDTFAAPDPNKRGVQFPDMVEGGAIKNGTGEAQSHGVRTQINDPRIQGPFETGWGFKDFEDQHDLIGLPNPMKE